MRRRTTRACYGSISNGSRDDISVAGKCGRSLCEQNFAARTGDAGDIHGDRPAHLRARLLSPACWLALPAAAEPLSEAEARAFGETKGRELLNTFAEKDPAVKYKKLDELFLNYVDLDYISRFVVGKHWRQMSAEQQKKYQELFTRYALNVYKGFPLSFDDNLDFVISDVERDGEYALVRTNIDYRGMDGKATTFLVEFRVHKKNGRIMITDIKVAESSLILSYRGRFYQMIADADEEMEWFLEDFELLADSGEKFYSETEE